MKKLFALFVVAAVVPAFAADRTGKLGLGFQESFTGGTFSAGNDTTLGDWSIKYGLAESATVQVTVGFDTGEAVNSNINLGARFLYDLVENENSDFYTGLGFLYVVDDANGDAPLRFNVPLGFEFSFAGLPEIGFSAEAGVMVDIVNNEDLAIRSVGGNVGGALGLGVHYYF